MPCLSDMTLHGPPQVLPLVVASRQYSAKLEMFRQLRDQAHPHAVSGGTGGASPRSEWRDRGRMPTQ